MSSTAAETRLSQTLETRAERFGSLSAGQSVEFTETVSESSSTCWRTVEVEMESVSSMEMSSESSIYIKLSASPKLLMDMSDVQVKTGEMAEFSCTFEGQPFNEVMWDHNGQRLVDTERVRSSQSGGLLSLVIQSVGVVDEGVYRCTAANQHGQNNCSAKLTVEGGLSFFFYHSICGPSHLPSCSLRCYPSPIF